MPLKRSGPVCHGAVWVWLGDPPRHRRRLDQRNALTTKGKIEAFIVTLGTMGIYRSLVTYFADGGTLSLNFDIRGTYRPVYYDSFLGLPIPVWVFMPGRHLPAGCPAEPDRVRPLLHRHRIK
jgi:hypothetical protein